MNWESAIVVLRNGGKVTRPNWEAEHYWILSKDGNERILCHDRTNASVHIKQTEADDWEMWIEERRIKCFWCEDYVTNLVEHTNEMHSGHCPRSYDFIKEKLC